MTSLRHPRFATFTLGVIALFASVLSPRWPSIYEPEVDVETFVAEARAANRRYESQREAINDGFTRVGVEFPAMGEHWVSFARVNEDSLSANRPSVLIYTNVDGKPRLAGVAYTKLLASGDSPPAFPFPGAWHEHSGAVNDESAHHGVVPSEAKFVVPSAAKFVVPSEVEGPAFGSSPRLYILHAWLYTPNPDGLFATDNWTLPLIKLGIAVSPVERDVMRAIALAQDDDDYHRLVVHTTLMLSDHQDSIAMQVIDVARLRAKRDVEHIRLTSQITPEASGRLTTTWSDMWRELERALPSRTNELRTLRAQM